MTWIMVDIEADGPIPGDYSMIEIGAVVVEDDLNRHFHSKLHPISRNWIPEALAVSGAARKETFDYPDPQDVMRQFLAWVNKVGGGKPRFISDNNGFDWMFVCWYFHHFLNENPFGHSSTNLGSLYKGIEKSMFKNFKHLRRTKHTHNALDDAIGNAEAFLTIIDQGLAIKLE